MAAEPLPFPEANACVDNQNDSDLTLPYWTDGEHIVSRWRFDKADLGQITKNHGEFWLILKYTDRTARGDWIPGLRVTSEKPIDVDGGSDSTRS